MMVDVMSRPHELFGAWRNRDGLPPVYLPNGMIALTDRHCHTRLVATGAMNTAMTLPAPPYDEHQLVLKNIGTGNVAVTASIDGITSTTFVASLESLRLEWSAHLATWLAV